eukprot:PhM_4_TR9824/c1_g2_i2/m.73416
MSQSSALRAFGKFGSGRTIVDTAAPSASSEETPKTNTVGGGVEQETTGTATKNNSNTNSNAQRRGGGKNKHYELIVDLPCVPDTPGPASAAAYVVKYGVGY